MFFLDKPYVSDFLKSTLKENFIPVVGTKIIKELDLPDGMNIISEEEAIELVKKSNDLSIYCTSENSIGWISKNLDFCQVPKGIELFKDKVKFRKLIKPLFPDFYFKAINFNDFDHINYEVLPSEFIIKPSIGFMSVGVHRVTCKKDWERTKVSIKEEVKQSLGLYPLEVINVKEFIIEECIDGDEYAVDVYFNALGEPVILNILEHIFFSDSDVGDRIYSTSKEIIEKNLQEFTSFMQDIGELANIQNFPLHVELRRDKNGILLPIEVNPMRFGGWCTTADVACKAYDFNPYLYYYNQKKPDWNKILANKKDELYSIVILDNSTGVSTNKVKSFDYEKLLSKFEEPLELREIDFYKYPVFGVLFTKTKKENMKELQYILSSDLKEFITY
jgi:ATP-grasp domain